MMEFFLYAILISIFYIYSGIGLSFLLCPKHFEKYCFYFSPFVGLAYLSYFSWFFFEYSNMGGEPIYYLDINSSLIFFVSSLHHKKRSL